MPLTQRSRQAIYAGLQTVVDDEGALDEMLSYFPSRDVEEPVTKDHLSKELAVQRAELEAEFAAVRVEMHEGFAQLRDEFRSQIHAEVGGLRGEMHREFAAVRGEMHQEFAAVRGEMHEGFRRNTMWLVTTMVALNTATIAAIISAAAIIR
jgi:hypothetical protein